MYSSFNSITILPMELSFRNGIFHLLLCRHWIGPVQRHDPLGPGRGLVLEAKLSPGGRIKAHEIGVLVRGYVDRLQSLFKLIGVGSVASCVYVGLDFGLNRIRHTDSIFGGRMTCTRDSVLSLDAKGLTIVILSDTVIR